MPGEPVSIKPGRELIEFIGVTHPLRTGVETIYMPEGATLLEMLRIAQPDPALLVDASVFIDDYEIPRDNWHLVRPRVGHRVTARVVPYLRGGGGDGEKSPLRILLTIAVIGAAFFLGPQLGLLLGLPESAVIFGATVNVASIVGGAIISFAGNLLINAIAPIKAPKLPTLSGSDPRESPSLFLAGSANSPRLFGTVPQVLGFFRFRPPLGAQTFTEVVGDTNHLRMLLVPGYGRLDLTDWEIDETSIDDFQDVELEVLEGVAADPDLTLYGNQVDQQEFAIKLLQVDGFTQRTSALDGDELSIDIAFPQGLVTFNDQGKRTNRTVVLQIQFRKVGDVTWLNLPADTITTLSSSAISGANVTFSAARSVAVRHGFRWKTGEREQWEIRVQRTTADSTDTRVFDEAFWVALRTFTLDDPISFRVPLAKAALNIRGTDQLNGVVQSLSVLAKSYVQTYTGTPDVWTLAISNNPAALFRHVLQGPAKAVPVDDALIDITKLEEWYDFCVAHNFTFNQVRDFSSSVQATLEDIAAAGRAGLTVADGKWSVVIDESISTITTHITPRNSMGFELEKSFEDLPHAWRFRFPNEDKRYAQDEVLVYFDGFSIDGAGGTTIATVFADLDIPGVTNSTQAFQLGRYLAAVIVNRPERWTVKQDFESIIAKRGSRVKITHDVMVVGLSSGRIASVTVDGGDNVDSITVDEPVVMESGKLYGITIRRDVLGDTAVIASVVTNVGEQTVLAISPVIPAAMAPDTGDLYGFGIRGSETEEAIVLGNIPEDEFSAKIIMAPYREAVFDADSETVPPFVPNVSDGVFLPVPVIQNIVTDESVIEVGTGDTTLVRAEIQVEPISEPDAFLEVQQRITGSNEPFYNSSVVLRNREIVRIGDVSTGETFDFRVRWNSPEKLIPSAYTQSTPTLIVGFSTPPQPLVNITLSVFGGQVFVRWDEPQELDVRFGGTVKFRHSPDLVAPLWQESVGIGQAVNARTLFATLPLKPGTYLARVFDSDGNPSTIVTVSTKQASVLEFANVDTLDEAPSFLGTHVNTVTIDGGLQLDGTALLDSVPDFDSIINFDSLDGGVELSGTYTFNLGFDLTTVKRVRLTTRVTAQSVDINTLIDSRTELMDTWEDFDGTTQAEADLIVEVRHTDDDPSGSPTWTTYERLDSAEFSARGFSFRAKLFTKDPSFNIICTVLGVDVEEVV